MPCIFCEIIKGNAPGSIMYADETVIVLMDINPVTVGHMMVIPKTHTASLAELDEATGCTSSRSLNGRRRPCALLNSAARVSICF